ncbi:MAG: hypothetical protein ACFB51_20505, partial [Anaerolineae bacterium]
GLPAADSDFQALVNFTLQDMAQDGTLEELAVRYFAPYRPEDEEIETFSPEIWPGEGGYLGFGQ